MTLRLGDIAPDFTADTTLGKIKFHEWLGNSWGVLFSHPRNYTPVCTTELGYTAKLKPEFDKRNVKAIGLSVDKLEDHHGWSKDIEETQGASLNFPLIADPDKTVANLYDMIHPNASDTFTVRSSCTPHSSTNLATVCPSVSRAAQRARLGAQSCARTGSPSWNFSPSRSLISTVRLSSDIV